MRIAPLLLAAAALALGASGAAMATDVAVSISGQVVPGVYGNVNIGSFASPPPLLYAQPVTIIRPARVVAVEPLYLHVPPGHARDWAKHCKHYNACERQVYFVKSADYDDDDRGHGKGKGHGKGHGKKDRD